MNANGIAAPTGVYIHIPFCAAKCCYCDFLSFVNENAWESYKYALINEIRAARETFLQETVIDTVYIGGGTPTVWPAPFLKEILTEIKYFNLATDAEITVEANPGTLDEEKLETLIKGGANRLSIGLQAWQDELLHKIGRIHTRADFLTSYMTACSAGFSNISVDVMFSLPGQCMEDWKETLSHIIALTPAHISAYSLTPEEHTPLQACLDKKELTLPDDETDRAMYAYANEYLSEAGYNHYEISNYAWPGYESRHNTGYWLRTPYYGFGLGAHSFDGHARWHNTYKMEGYITDKHTNEQYERTVITQMESMSESMFLGLRLMDGIAHNKFFKEYGQYPRDVYGEAIDRLIDDGLLADERGRLSLTARGMDLANIVFACFL